jgi:hypothetical protein
MFMRSSSRLQTAETEMSSATFADTFPAVAFPSLRTISSVSDNTGESGDFPDPWQVGHVTSVALFTGEIIASGEVLKQAFISRPEVA